MLLSSLWYFSLQILLAMLISSRFFVPSLRGQPGCSLVLSAGLPRNSLKAEPAVTGYPIIYSPLQVTSFHCLVSRARKATLCFGLSDSIFTDLSKSNLHLANQIHIRQSWDGKTSWKFNFFCISPSPISDTYSNCRDVPGFLTLLSEVPLSSQRIFFLSLFI